MITRYSDLPQRLTHQGSDVVLEDCLALEEDSAVGGIPTSVVQSASPPADYGFALQSGFSHRVAELKRGDRGPRQDRDRRRWSTTAKSC